MTCCSLLQQAEEDGASVRSFDDVPNLEVTTAFEGPAFKKKSNIKRQTLSGIDLLLLIYFPELEGLSESMSNCLTAPEGLFIARSEN